MGVMGQSITTIVTKKGCAKQAAGTRGRRAAVRGLANEVGEDRPVEVSRCTAIKWLPYRRLPGQRAQGPPFPCNHTPEAASELAICSSQERYHRE